MGYYSVLKRREFAKIWMDLESIKQTEIMQTEKDKYCMILLVCGFPRWISGERQPAIQEIQSLGFGRAPGGGHGNPHQYFCLENFMNRGAQ